MTAADGTVACPFCGKRYRKKGAPAPYGMPQRVSVPTPRPTAPGKKAPLKQRRKGLAAVLLLCLVLCLGAAGYWFFLRPFVVSFSWGYDTDKRPPAQQSIRRGDRAKEPVFQLREGYLFLGWYTEDRPSVPYRFENEVSRSFTLTGKWVDSNDTQDSDADGLFDSIENCIGTDPFRPDTDGDGLSDYVEFKVLGLDPLSRDTDGNGIPDGREDSDGDGLLNAEEVELGTSPLWTDSDGDGLSDFDEVKTYPSSPLSRDTDLDGVDDRTELRIGSDPLTAETLFTTERASSPVSETDTVSLSVSAETDSEGAGSLSITPIVSTYIPALSPASRGYMGYAYEVSAEGSLSGASLSFRYDTSLGELSEDFQPRIYYYDETENQLVELENQVVENGCVTAETTHFSVYILLNKAQVEAGKLLITAPPDAMEVDSNNDRLPDYFANCLNDGALLYDNSDCLVGVLDMFGTEDDDWDDDGLKNGQEVSIVPFWGRYYLYFRSNPLLRDSDFDGLDDSLELTVTNTNPLRYDRHSVGALNSLENDGRYLYMNRNKGWEDDFALNTDFAKKDEAKACLINYFYDYAPEETILKNAETIERQESLQQALEIYGVVSKLCGTAKSLNSALEAGGENADLQAHYYESIHLRKNLLSDLNYGVANSQLIADYLSEFSLPTDLARIVKEYGSGTAAGMIAGSAGLIEIASTSLAIYNEACQVHIYSLAREFEDAIDFYDQQSLSLIVPNASLGLTVACDLVKAGGDLMEVTSTYAKLRANADAFNMYLQLLLYIRDNAEEGFVREAAGEIVSAVMSRGGYEYYSQLTKACARTLALDAFRLTVDVLAKEVPLVAVAKAIFDLYQQTGVTDLAKYNVYYAVMQAVSNGSKAMLRREIKESEQTFSYYPEASAWVEKYLVQLAQSRIIGEYYFHEYCASNSGASFIAALLSGTSPEEYRQRYHVEVKEIYSYANRLHLKLSRSLPYYDEFWSDTVPEDPISLPAMEEDLFTHYPEAARAYLDLLLQEELPIKSYDWQMRDFSSESEGSQTSYPVCFCDFYGDKGPEMIYVKRPVSGLMGPSRACARLIIVTCDGGELRLLYSCDWDGLAASGLGYYFFQVLNEKTLYVYTRLGDEWWKDTYYCLKPTADGTLELAEHLQHYSHPDYSNYQNTVHEYTQDSQRITQEDFVQAELRLQADTTCILMRNIRAGDFAARYVRGNGCAAMTWEGAVAYLRGFPTSEVQYPDAPDLFSRIPSQYIFWTGAFGWSTDLTIQPDGSFTGDFHDMDYADGSDGVYGIMKLSEFSGRFVNPKKINSFTYSFQLQELRYSNEAGTEETLDLYGDGQLYRIEYTTAYGLDGGDTFYLYTRDAPLDLLPEDFLDWIRRPEPGLLDGEGLLPVTGLYNVAEKEGFYSMEDLAPAENGEIIVEPAPDPDGPAWSAAYRDFVLNKQFLVYGDSTAGYGELENGAAVVSFALHDMNGDGTPELLIFNGFNGRDLQANYVFTYTGSGIAYCGTTLAAAYAVDGYPGLFAAVTKSGWYLDEPFAGQYDEVTYLDHYSLNETLVTKESVSVSGLPAASSERVLISRTADEVLYQASQAEPRYLSVMTWSELNSRGWESFLALAD